MGTAVQLRGISKSFEEKAVLKEVTLKLEEGNFYALLGKNGAGKSTLMRIVTRFEQPTAGTGEVLGLGLDIDSPEVNRGVGYVAESIGYTVPVDLKTFFSHYRRLYPSWDEALFHSVLQEMRIDPRSYFADLSRGQKMHVAFAAALAGKPRLLLLDEITSVLDAHARRFFMQYLGEFTRGGGTVLLATNILADVQSFATHLILLSEGTIQLDCPLSSIPELGEKGIGLEEYFIALTRGEGK